MFNHQLELRKMDEQTDTHIPEINQISHNFNYPSEYPSEDINQTRNSLASQNHINFAGNQH